MLRGSIDPDPNAAAARLSAKLMALIQKANPDVVVYEKAKPVRRKHYTGNELVNVMTANDGNVCKACLEIAAGGPYRYHDVRKTIPHHPGCRCYVKRVGVADTGFLFEHARPTFKQFTRAVKAHLVPKIRRRRKAVGAPQRNAAISRMRKKGKKFVAPHGKRAIARQLFLQKMGRRWQRKPKKD
jgi:hypothetical protein